MNASDAHFPGARPDVRASDAERERVAGLLTRHAAEARLTREELAERIEQAYAARTVTDLERLQRELPAEAEPRPRREPEPDGRAGRARNAPMLALLAFAAVVAVVARAAAGDGDGWLWWPFVLWGFAAKGWLRHERRHLGPAGGAGAGGGRLRAGHPRGRLDSPA